MKPLNDRVLVKRLESEEKTAGGLFIPDAAKEKPSKGEVIACGPGKLNDKGERVAMEVKPGDIVLFAKYAGTEIKVNGADHIIMREEDISPFSTNFVQLPIFPENISCLLKRFFSMPRPANVWPWRGQLANAVKVTLGPRVATFSLKRPTALPSSQGRRDRGQGN